MYVLDLKIGETPELEDGVSYELCGCSNPLTQAQKNGRLWRQDVWPGSHLNTELLFYYLLANALNVLIFVSL